MSTKDWDALLQQMHAILATEGEVALFIGQQFQRSADDARSANLDAQKTRAIRDALAASERDGVCTPSLTFGAWT